MDYGKDAIALFSKQLIRWGHSYDCLYGPGDKPCNNEVAMAILNKPQSTSPSCFCTCGTMLTFTFSLNIDLTKPLQRYKCHHKLCHTYWGHSQSNAHWNLLPSDYYECAKSERSCWLWSTSLYSVKVYSLTHCILETVSSALLAQNWFDYHSTGSVSLLSTCLECRAVSLYLEV